MADSEKKDSSTGEAKEKLSLFDEDFSKDFLTWKSGGDDMDFNFEPVSKGKKKAFDFSMDMDFSLDDAFGKMSSFKMDVSDIDFSVSPCKSTKSKEKSEEKSAKGNGQDKLYQFNFSLDFDGMNVSDGENDHRGSKCLSNGKLPPDAINASSANDSKTLSLNDRSSAEMQKPVLKVSSAPIGSERTNAKPMLLENKIPGVMDSKLPTVQATVDGDRTNFSASDDNQEGLIHIGAVNRSYDSSEVNGKKLDDHPSSCTKELIKSDSVMEKSEQNAAACISLRNHNDTVNGKNKNEVSIDTVPHNAKTGNEGSPSLDCEKMTKVKSSGAMNFSLEDAFGKMSSIKKIMPDTNFSNPQNKSKKSKETSEEDSAKGNCLDKHGKLTFSFDSNVESTIATTVPLENEVPGVRKSKLASLQATNDGCRLELSASQVNREGSTHMEAVNRSKQNGTKSDDNPSSCTKGMTQSDSVLGKNEKNAAAAPTPRDHDDSVNGKKRNEISGDTLLHKGKLAKDGLPSLECEKMTNNVKSSSFKYQSSTPPDLGTKSGNLGHGNLKDRIANITMIQKPNLGQWNKLSSQRVDKKIFALPSLKITRHTTTDKHPAALNSSAKSLENVEKCTEIQAMIKTACPVFAEKQTPSTPSLKRKPSEATDMGPAKLHMPKRFSPNESRIPKVSVRELEDEVQTQGSLVEENTKNVSAEDKTPKFDFDQEAALQFSLMVENDANVEKAEACAKELDMICNMLKKKHEEAKELLVQALVNNNNLLMLSHPIYDEKISLYYLWLSQFMLLSVIGFFSVINFARSWKKSYP